MRASAFLLLATAGLAQAADLPAAPQSFTASFVETNTLPGFDTPLVSHGNVTFDRTAGVTWEVTAPYHYLFRMQSGDIEEQLPDGTRRRIEVDQAPWLDVMQRVFNGTLAGDTTELARYFEVQITPIAGGRQIELTPKPGVLAQAIRHISVTEQGTPHVMHIDEISGGRIEIRFQDIHTTPVKP